MSGGEDRFAPHAQAVARDILGEPNKHLSKPDQLRFGTHGSLSVDVETGQFYDHQEGVGGGVLWFIERQTGRTVAGGEAIKWMTENGYDVEDRDRSYQPRGSGPDSGQSGPARGEARTDPEGNWVPPNLPEGAYLAKTYDYRQENGALAYQVCRFEWPEPASEKGRGKHFLQRIPDDKKRHGWTYKTKGMEWLPYRLGELRDDIDQGLEIFFVEGEKKVDMLRDLGIPATCNHGGSGKFPAELVDHFRGAKVCLLPDNDEPGRKHVELVARRIRKTAERVRILEIPGLPPKGGVDDWLPAGGNAEKLYDLLAERAHDFRPPPPESVFGGVPWLDLPKPGPTLDYLVKGVLARSEISILVGESQSGKSFLALDIAMAVARGSTFFGRRVTRGGVIYQAGESAVGMRRRRIPAYAQHHDVEGENLPFVLLQRQLDLFGGDEPADALINEIAAWSDTFDCPTELVVIDTFNRATPGANENDGRDMSLVLERCEKIRQQTGAHVMLVHHLNAGGTKARGHTSLRANVDAEIIVKKVENAKDGNGRQVREWAITKQKDGEDGGTHRFVLPGVQIGVDRDGDRITSCIVAEPADGAGATAGGYADEGITLAGTNAVFLRAVHNALAASGAPAPAALDLPQRTLAVNRSDVWSHLRALLASDDGTIEQKEGESEEDAAKRRDATLRQQVKRARDHLFSRAVIGVSEDWIWLTGKPVRGFPNPRRSLWGDDRAAEDDQDVPTQLPFDVDPDDFK